MKFMTRGNDKTCGRFDNPHDTVIMKTVCLKCGECSVYDIADYKRHMGKYEQPELILGNTIGVMHLEVAINKLTLNEKKLLYQYLNDVLFEEEVDKNVKQ